MSRTVNLVSLLQINVVMLHTQVQPESCEETKVTTITHDPLANLEGAFTPNALCPGKWSGWRRCQWLRRD